LAVIGHASPKKLAALMDKISQISSRWMFNIDAAHTNCEFATNRGQRSGDPRLGTQRTLADLVAATVTAEP
jgi:hypothetical protein